MDLENQKRVKISLRSTEPRTLSFSWVPPKVKHQESQLRRSQPVTRPMQVRVTGVSLGLVVYHVCEDEVKEEFDPDVYDEQVSMMEMVLDIDEIAEEMQAIREEYSSTKNETPLLSRRCPRFNRPDF